MVFLQHVHAMGGRSSRNGRQLHKCSSAVRHTFCSVVRCPHNICISAPPRTRVLEALILPWLHVAIHVEVASAVAGSASTHHGACASRMRVAHAAASTSAHEYIKTWSGCVDANDGSGVHIIDVCSVQTGVLSVTWTEQHNATQQPSTQPQQVPVDIAPQNK